jgi:hypothetical protein
MIVTWMLRYTTEELLIHYFSGYMDEISQQWDGKTCYEM